MSGAAAPAAVVTARVPEDAAGESRLLRFSVLLSFVLLALPVAVAPFPPLWDYPNHLARLWLLAGGADIAPVSDWYRTVWDSLTNVAVDALAAHLAPWLGWMATGRLTVLAAVLLPPLGGMMLWRSIHGRLHWWIVAFVLMAWGTSLLAGFINFQIGIGLALVAASADRWIASRESHTAALLRTLIAALLIGVHVFGFVFYAGLLLALAIGPTRDGVITMIRRLVPAFGPVAAAALIFVLAAPHLPGAQVGAGAASLVSDFTEGWKCLFNEPLSKLQRALLVVSAYRPSLDSLTVAAIGLPLVRASVLRRLEVHFGLAVAAVGFALCYFLFPDLLGGTYWIDTRFAVMAPFAFAAAVKPDVTGSSGRLLAISLICIACTRTVVVASIWHARQADVRSLQQALAVADPGSMILPLQQRPADLNSVPEGRYLRLGGSSFRHLPTLALPWQHSFAPTLFAARGKQPIQVRSEMRLLAEPEGGDLADVDALRNPVAMTHESAVAPYARHWRDHFAYVLVVNADVIGETPPLADTDTLILLRDTGFARLYRVYREGV